MYRSCTAVVEPEGKDHVDIDTVEVDPIVPMLRATESPP